jgi:hypothetical protein
MLHLHRCLTIFILSGLLLSGCAPVVLPAPMLITPASNQVVTPPVAPELTTTPLLRVVIDLDEPRDIGSGQLGMRYVSYFTGGEVSGLKLQGVVLPDGEIWYLIRRDHIAELVIRGVVQTSDDALIAFQAKAFSQAAPLTTKQLFSAELIDPSAAFFRGVAFFKSDAPSYAWLNHAVTIATYHYDLKQVVIAVYAVN